MNLVKAPKEALLSSLSIVGGIVERRHTLPILANVLMRRQGSTLELTSSDLEIQISTRVEMDGDPQAVAITVAARKLLDILRSVPDAQEVKLDLSGTKLSVRAGKSRFSLQTLPADDFPLVASTGEFSAPIQIQQGLLKDLISQVHFAMAVHDIRYYLNGILMVADGKRLTMVATDGHRLAVAHAELPEEVGRRELILPRKSVLELSRLLSSDKEALVQLEFAHNQARIKLGSIDFVSKLVEGKFPDYQRVIPKGYKFTIPIERAELLSALQRVSILSNDKFRGVKLNFEPGVMRISSNNAEQEDAVEEMEIDYPGDSVEIGFNVSYLVDVLSNLDSSSIALSLQDSNSSVLFTVPGNEHFKYVVMPMRI